ncbi:bifunctional metallophosphatase/5'-nucleotidase [Sutcliffiella rhizosphaerae]|uniref:Trifunctional nucleotide phosphoesterase protein YfkN n=1 Tax=Sutcliffiella rhizosphaerae TaxID=2880967 RepID=A0ABN8A646_9BACI|nr:bifunctional UDP-sugar hydrolase/5'-nucleotidase [Sutcliffiella rhizosphaerae]CAG9620563.1 Trifunctional nucleotide phosphoesterase protein YfkN [Sutcliffiella rhizosphaerae]
MLRLSIVETSDLHGSILPINYGNNKYLPAGLAKVSTYLKELREKNPNVLTIDNGDLIQGTPLTYHYVKKLSTKENPMIKVLNHLQYDAAVIGNHEFNYGDAILKQAVNSSDFPWLSANILEEETGVPFLGKPYIIKVVEDVRIVILGVTTHYIPNWENPEHIKGLSFEDAYESTKKWVNFIQINENPDLLVVSYHGGFERDPLSGQQTETLTGENQGYKMCKEISGIDVLLTGHQHRKIATKINGVLVLQPGVSGNIVGQADITLDKRNGKWEVIRKEASLVSLDEVSPDQEVIEIIKEYEQATQMWLDKPIGKIKGDMSMSNAQEIRTRDHALIEFINKVQMHVSGATISNTALFHNNALGFPSDVTMRDIVSNYIYPNTLKVIKITGQDIKDALERSATYFIINSDGKLDVNPSFTTPKPQHYNYDMWEGIDYILDISKPVGERVIKLERNECVLDLSKEYEVVMNNYRAGGGGDYIMYKNKPVIKDIPMDMSELIANYILEKREIEATVNNNWKIIW